MDELKPTRLRQVLNAFYGILTMVLWLFTNGLGLLCVYFTRQTIVRICGSLFIDYRIGSAIGSVMIFVLGLALLGYAIGSGEYHLKHFNTPQSWQIFAIAIGVELMLLILYFVV